MKFEKWTGDFFREGAEIGVLGREDSVSELKGKTKNVVRSTCVWVVCVCVCVVVED